MLASIAMDPMEFAFSCEPVACATPAALRSTDTRVADPEHEALIRQIESVEGAPLGRTPMLFRLVLLCGGVICAGAGGGLVLGVADLLGRLV